MTRPWIQLFVIIGATSICFDGRASAQSTQIDQPTALTSREVIVKVGGPATHYFSFEAGPGDLSFVFAAQLNGGAYSGGSLHWTLSDENMKVLDSAYPSFGVNTEEQKIKRYHVDGKGTFVLEVTVLSLADARGTARYRIKLGGDVNIDEKIAAVTLPQVK